LIKQHANTPPIDILAKHTVEAPSPHIDSKLLSQFKEICIGRGEQQLPRLRGGGHVYMNTHTSQDIGSTRAFQEAEVKNIKILCKSTSQPLTQPAQVKEPPRVKVCHLPTYKLRRKLGIWANTPLFLPVPISTPPSGYGDHTLSLTFHVRHLCPNATTSMVSVCTTNHDLSRHLASQDSNMGNHPLHTIPQVQECHLLKQSLTMPLQSWKR
jgi:hypothetical protein